MIKKQFTVFTCLIIILILFISCVSAPMTATRVQYPNEMKSTQLEAMLYVIEFDEPYIYADLGLIAKGIFNKSQKPEIDKRIKSY